MFVIDGFVPAYVCFFIFFSTTPIQFHICEKFQLELGLRIAFAESFFVPLGLWFNCFEDLGRLVYEMR